MRFTVIALQIGLISTLAVIGALASADDRPDCPLGQSAVVVVCET